MNRVNYIIFLASIGLLALVPMEKPFSYEVDATQTLAKTFPYQLGDWKGKDIRLDERTYEILETRNVLSRMYENPKGENIHLMIVASAKDRRVAHPPEVCFISSDFSLLNQETHTFNIGSEAINLKSFVAKDKKNQLPDEKVFYVYKVGKLFTTNYYVQQLIFAWNRLMGKESEIQLIRLPAKPDSPFQNLFVEVLQSLS